MVSVDVKHHVYLSKERHRSTIIFLAARVRARFCHADTLCHPDTICHPDTFCHLSYVSRLTRCLHGLSPRYAASPRGDKSCGQIHSLHDLSPLRQQHYNLSVLFPRCVCVCVCASGCCFVSANGLLVDVCQCCCLLMFVCLPLSRHFPCCKTW